MQRLVATNRVVVTIVLAMAVAAGCSEGREDERPAPAIDAAPPPPFPASAASAPTDTVPLETLILWDAAAAQRALRSDRLTAEVLRDRLSYAGLTNGVAYQVGRTEVHLFFYGDIGAVDLVYRQLDARQLRPVGARVAPGAEPQVLVNNNMLVVLYGGDDVTRRQIWRALTPGAEDRDAETVEP